jgi:site-specific DNA-methyltransferase (adenine-specific)
MQLVTQTKLGLLYKADCLAFLAAIPDASAATFFADPPFNLGKRYGELGCDTLPDRDYLVWCEDWLRQAVRILKPGGALFVHNLPKWLIPIGSFLNATSEMFFRHWIALYRPQSLPIPNRLFPAHYGILYYIKGDRPRVFGRDRVRTPIAKCRGCGTSIKDYGGHRKALNPKGLNLTDVWTDVPAVRHAKYKHRPANELTPRIVERIVLLSTRKGDLIVDPFVGSGTTAFVAEKFGRRWICADLNDCNAAKERVEATGREDGCGSTHRNHKPVTAPVVSKRGGFSPKSAVGSPRTSAAPT